MLYRLYRIARSVPGGSALANATLRATRNLFWSLRPAASPAGARLPDDYIAFVEGAFVGDDFTLIEVGAGDGRTLYNLALRYPRATFIGVDIQKAAVTEGVKYLGEQGVTNVKLFCASCLEDTLDWNCDYLISRTALIYLNRVEMEEFLSKRLPQVRRQMLLQEIVSLTGRTEASHFFAHPLADMAERADHGAFSASIRFLDYIPWIREGHWSGAEVSVRRVSSVAED